MKKDFELRISDFGLVVALLLLLPEWTNAARISLLSLAKPTTVDVSVAGQAAVMQVDEGREQPAEKPLQARLLSGKISLATGQSAKRIAIRCPAGCSFDIRVPAAGSRTYHGTSLALGTYNNTISIVLDSDNDSLGASILMSEASGYARGGPELFKALAVLVRTFLLSAPRHPDIGADFCDTTHCQVFRALPADARSLAAVRQTAGIVVGYRGKPFRPFYSTACGGTTATFREVWGEDSPDYPFFAVACEGCRKMGLAGGRRWTARLTRGQQDRLAGFPVTGAGRTAEGSVWLAGTGGRRAVWTPENFRILVGRQLGWNVLYSNLFQVRQCGAHFCFDGEGRGHRVGLCMYGASVMARAGSDFRRILAHYYPETELLLMK